MFEVQPIETDDKRAFYTQLSEQVRAPTAGEGDRIANTANVASLLFHALPDVVWVGFYFFDGQELVVGPFQGKPACVRIPIGRGVCGRAAQERQTVIVADVNEFDDHIVCDAESRSEIVVPIIDDRDALIGVLDIDSASTGRFDAEDAVGLEQIVRILRNG